VVFARSKKTLDAFELFYGGVKHGIVTSLSRDFLMDLRHELEGCRRFREADFVHKQTKCAF
jgi:hypothetical protein